MSVGQSVLRTLATWGMYIVLVLLLVAAQGLLDMWGVLSYLAGAPIFIILHIALLVWVFRREYHGLFPPERREAHVSGLPARALVRAARPTRGRLRRRMGPWRREHLLELEVERPGQPPYPARLALYLTYDRPAPAAGDTLDVLVHPTRRDVVVPVAAHLAWPWEGADSDKRAATPRL